MRTAGGWLLLPLGVVLVGQEVGRYLLPHFGFYPARSGNLVALAIPWAFSVVGWLLVWPGARMAKVVGAIGLASVGVQLALTPLRTGTFEFSAKQWAGIVLGVVLVAISLFLLRDRKAEDRGAASSASRRV